MKISFTILSRYCALRWYHPTTAMCREPLCPKPGVTCFGMMSCIMSEGITPPSSLILAHAPDQNPPADFGLNLFQQVFAGCRQSLLGDGPSRHYLCNPCVGAWTPTPQCPSSALARFFPEGNDLTSNVTGSAHQNTPCSATSTGFCFSGLQSFHYVQAPILARPSGCTHHWTSKCPGRPSRLHHASPRWLPIPRCGIATCLNWATGTTGLSPAGLWPYRLLCGPIFSCNSRLSFEWHEDKRFSL